MPNRTWSDTDLKHAIAANTTIVGALKSLGLSSSPGNAKTFIKYVKLLKLDLSHFTGKPGIPSNARRRSLEEILVLGSQFSSAELRKRLIKEGLLLQHCANCNLGTTWNNKPIVLQLDHTNGDPYDNRIENLRLLCPNCHSQTNTFRGRNAKGRYRNPVRLCSECGRKVVRTSKTCPKCHGKKSRKIAWPPANNLALLVVKYSYRAVGHALGVSDNAVRKHIKTELGYMPIKARGPSAGVVPRDELWSIAGDSNPTLPCLSDT